MHSTKPKLNLLAIDIGNSRIKLYKGNRLFSISNKSDIELTLMDYLCNNCSNQIVYSSVNKQSEQILLEVLYRLKIDYIKIEELIDKSTRIDFSSVSGMGTDRKLGLISAAKLVPPPIITIDFGTCITINVVDANFKCIGGHIIPGLITQTKALNTFTSALPQIMLNYSGNLIGTDTESAINTGILNITFKGINAQVLDICKTFPSHAQPSIILTGGISELANKFPFSFPYKWDDSLVIKGIWALGCTHFKHQQ